MSSSLKGRPWLQTVKGRAWCADAPEDFTYDIEEFAHALANLCRFTGQLPEFYSVAQHSVLVARVVLDNLPSNMPLAEVQRLCRAAILHDAAESLLVDLPAPVKRLPALEGYRCLLKRTEIAIAKQFGLYDLLDHALIKHADVVVLATEKRDVRNASAYDSEWSDLPAPMVSRIKPMTPSVAKAYFLDAWSVFGGSL